jgi:hypothetical protein
VVLYATAILAGTVVTALALGVLKKPLPPVSADAPVAASA